MIVLSCLTICVTCFTGAFLLVVFMIFPILAAAAASRGEWYTYPGLGGFADRQPGA